MARYGSRNHIHHRQKLQKYKFRQGKSSMSQVFISFPSFCIILLNSRNLKASVRDVFWSKWRMSRDGARVSWPPLLMHCSWFVHLVSLISKSSLTWHYTQEPLLPPRPLVLFSLHPRPFKWGNTCLQVDTRLNLY